MGVGPKIKELRNKVGLTQKELADELHVTYQAVSRWENNDTEPSFDTIKEMCRIFNCSVDELFGVDTPKNVEIPEEITKIIEKQLRPVLGVCEKCNKPIYESTDLHRIDESSTIASRKRHETVVKQTILCNECNEIRLQEEKENAEKERQKKLAHLKKQRIHSFIWPSICASIFIALSIISFIKGDVTLGKVALLVSLLTYTFVATMILNNTFITEIWFDISSWGFVKFPSVIFQLSFDGIAFLIAVKILFFILGMLLSLSAIIFSTVISMILSVFVYPFALMENGKHELDKA